MIASVLAGAATDAVGNASLVSASTDNTVNVSNTNFFRNEILATGFNLPTAIKFLPDGRLLVAELRARSKSYRHLTHQPDPTPFLRSEPEHPRIC